MDIMVFINMLLQNTLIATIILGIFWIVKRLQERRVKAIPPGPMPLPFIGTLYKHAMFPLPYELNALSKHYGNIMSIRIGFKQVVVLSEINIIQEALSMEAFANRGMADTYTFRLLCENNGLFRADYNQKMIKDRKHIMTSFQKLGVGKSLMEDVILREVSGISEYFNTLTENTIDPSRIINLAIANIILHLIFDIRFDYNDADLQLITDGTTEITRDLYYITAIDLLPILQYLPPFRGFLRRWLKLARDLLHVGGKYVQFVIDRFEPGQESCLADLWLQQHYDCKDDSLKYDHGELTFLLVDLTIAGLETSAHTLKWFVIYITNRPALQQKLFEEIRSNVGLSREVKISDKESLPLLQATIQETQRMCNVVPLVLRQTNKTRDIQLHDYTIEKGTIILANAVGVHNNVTTWKDPDVFRPERFLSAGAKKVVPNRHMMPFGLGKRSCAGDILAKQELFLITSNLVQKFAFCLPEGKEEIDERPLQGTFWVPRPYKINIKQR